MGDRSFRLRLVKGEKGELGTATLCQLGELRLARGQARYGPVNLALGWTEGEHTAPWSIATDAKAVGHAAGGWSENGMKASTMASGVDFRWETAARMRLRQWSGRGGAAAGAAQTRAHEVG